MDNNSNTKLDRYIVTVELLSTIARIVDPIAKLNTPLTVDCMVVIWLRTKVAKSRIIIVYTPVSKINVCVDWLSVSTYLMVICSTVLSDFNSTVGVGTGDTDGSRNTWPAISDFSEPNSIVATPTYLPAPAP